MIDWRIWLAALWLTGILCFTLAFSTAKAEDQWADSPYKGWADLQQVMPEARYRFNCGQPPQSCSCCNGAEIVKTKFRVAGNHNDAWDWLNPKTNQWERVPDDIIHWGAPTPDKQAVLFEYPIGSGTPRCFFPPQAEGG